MEESENGSEAGDDGEENGSQDEEQELDDDEDEADDDEYMQRLAKEAFKLRVLITALMVIHVACTSYTMCMCFLCIVQVCVHVCSHVCHMLCSRYKTHSLHRSWSHT